LFYGSSLVGFGLVVSNTEKLTSRFWVLKNLRKVNKKANKHKALHKKSRVTLPHFLLIKGEIFHFLPEDEAKGRNKPDL
jgi:hypothetical protein